MTSAQNLEDAPEGESVTVGLVGQLAQKSDPTVTQADRTNAERQRRWRGRKKEKAARNAASNPITYEEPDWQRYLSPSTLPSKAGVSAWRLRRLALKEAVDNALDADPKATLDKHGDTYVIRDGGPGLDPDEALRMFAVNRDHRTSKMMRKPTRGALGHGLRIVMGAVAASDGELIVTSRGVCQRLDVDRETGETISERTSVPDEGATTVELRFGPGLHADAEADSLARIAIKLARAGNEFTGPCSPHWYDADALRRLLRAAQPGVIVGRIAEDLGVHRDDEREARALSPDDAKALLDELRGAAGPAPALPRRGRHALEGHYAIEKDEVPVEGVDIPCIIEAWATCERASKADSGVELMICVNGTPVPGDVAAWFQKAQLVVQGCGLRNLVGNVSAGIYDVTVNITAPCVPITTEGKEPHLLPFLDPLGDAIISACKGAKRDLGADSGMSIKEAADAVMKDAYLKASGNGTYPANARQIMYAARPQILELTGGRIWEKDTYFTQTLLPDYMAEHPDETADWDVVFDADESDVSGLTAGPMAARDGQDLQSGTMLSCPNIKRS